MFSVSNFLTRFILLLCLLQVSACSSLSYLFHTSSGHLQVMSQRQSIEALIEDDATESDDKKALQDVLRIREFASHELSLPNNKSYTSYVALNRDYVTWAVFAAEPYSLQAKTWCFIVVGCVPYRGYFSHQKALDFSLQLQQQGYETYVGPVPAYSTLGWFSDPVLSSMLNHGQVATAEYIFHELAHQQLYIKNDPSFNEAFATAVGQLGVSRWLIAEGKQNTLENYIDLNDNKIEIYEIIGNLRKQLTDIYLSDDISFKQTHKEKALKTYHRVMTEKLNSWGRYDQYKKWLLEDINNAKLNAFSTYRKLVPQFLALYERCGNSLNKFYSTIDNMKALDKQQRLEQLKNGQC